MQLHGLYEFQNKKQQQTNKQTNKQNNQPTKSIVQCNEIVLNFELCTALYEITI